MRRKFPMKCRHLTSLLLVALGLVARDTQAQTALSADTLERLRQASTASHSTALVVWHDGRFVVCEYADGSPRKLQAMSITKSIASLAIGRMLTTGALRSLDTPVHEFFPEWRQGQKRSITVRHLLTHTSGIQDLPNAGTEIESSPDVVKLALAAELVDPPGSRFTYNNKAVNLLAGIVRVQTGKPLDRYLKDEVFSPVGIHDVDWACDSAGNPYVYAQLAIYPKDLAKLGVLMLNRGVWNGRRVIDMVYFDEIWRGSPLAPRLGLLWGLVPAATVFIIDDSTLSKLRDVGVDSAFVAQLSTIRGRYPSFTDLIGAFCSLFGSDWPDRIGAALAGKQVSLERREYGPTIGYQASGYLGQYLVILPAARLVSVRMIAPSPHYRAGTDSFEEFTDYLRALVRLP